jgi:hypothetical protein
MSDRVVDFRLKYNCCCCLAELSKEKHGWSCQNYAETFDLSFATVKDNVPRVDASKLSVEEFVEQYEKTYTPVVLTNVQNDWSANYKWTLDVRKFLFILMF